MKLSKQTEPPTEELLSKEISKAKRTAQKVNANDVAENIEALEEQLENEKGSADGKMKILDGLRNELLKLDSAEKVAEWPKVEQELKDAFYELEDLIEKIKANNDDDDLNMDQVEAHIQEYKKTIEHVIKDKILKDAKELIGNINSFKFHLVSELTDNAQDAQIVRRLNTEFSSIRWKDGTKARQLLNHCLQLANDGKTKTIRPILVQIVGLMHDGETLKDTLG